MITIDAGSDWVAVFIVFLACLGLACLLLGLLLAVYQKRTVRQIRKIAGVTEPKVLCDVLERIG